MNSWARIYKRDPVTDNIITNNIKSDNAEEGKERKLLIDLQAGSSKAMQNHKGYFNELKRAGVFTVHSKCKHGLGIELKDLMNAMQPVHHFYIKMCEVQRPDLEYNAAAFVGDFSVQSQALSKQSAKVLQVMTVSFIQENATHQDYKDPQNAFVYFHQA